MTSALQAQSNARNAQHSTGPQSPEGKARAARNAVRYGYCAADIVMPGEDRAAFDTLLAELRTTWEPSNPEQSRCVDDLAAALWRRERLRCTEGELWANRCDANGETPRSLGDAFASDCDSNGRALDKLRRWWNANERVIDRCRARLGLMKRFETRLQEMFGPDVSTSAATLAADMRAGAARESRQVYERYMNAPLPGPGLGPEVNYGPEPEPAGASAPQHEIGESTEPTQSTLPQGDQPIAAPEAPPATGLTQEPPTMVQARTRRERRALERVQQREEKHRAESA